MEPPYAFLGSNDDIEIPINRFISDKIGIIAPIMRFRQQQGVENKTIDIDLDSDTLFYLVEILSMPLISRETLKEKFITDDLSFENMLNLFSISSVLLIDVLINNLMSIIIDMLKSSFYMNLIEEKNNELFNLIDVFKKDYPFLSIQLSKWRTDTLFENKAVYEKKIDQQIKSIKWTSDGKHLIMQFLHSVKVFELDSTDPNLLKLKYEMEYKTETGLSRMIYDVYISSNSKLLGIKTSPEFKTFYNNVFMLYDLLTGQKIEELGGDFLSPSLDLSKIIEIISNKVYIININEKLRYGPIYNGFPDGTLWFPDNMKVVITDMHEGYQGEIYNQYRIVVYDIQSGKLFDTNSYTNAPEKDFSNDLSRLLVREIILDNIEYNIYNTLTGTPLTGTFLTGSNESDIKKEYFGDPDHPFLGIYRFSFSPDNHYFLINYYFSEDDIDFVESESINKNIYLLFDINTGKQIKGEQIEGEDFFLRNDDYTEYGEPVFTSDSSKIIIPGKIFDIATKKEVLYFDVPDQIFEIYKISPSIDGNNQLMKYYSEKQESNDLPDGGFTNVTIIDISSIHKRNEDIPRQGPYLFEITLNELYDKIGYSSDGHYVYIILKYKVNRGDKYYLLIFDVSTVDVNKLFKIES